ncbi:MAG: hypothetical protein JRJ31_22950, partial [Deltaproteobacteria bacterium]|nr:hypothetical protein [Deltaproteobacteria bacterium]
KSHKERRLAADFQYHASYARRLFDAAIGRDIAEEEQWPEEVMALAIDPTCAPALLTIGSYEYIFGRKDKAMIHFLALTKLPEETEELVEIIEKAAGFLVENEEFEDAIRLYLSAISERPNTAVFHNGISHCYGRLGDSSKALQEGRVAVVLDPLNHLYLADLG